MRPKCLIFNPKLQNVKICPFWHSIPNTHQNVFRLNHELNKTFLRPKLDLLPNMSILIFHTQHSSMHMWPKNNIQHFLWLNEDRNPNSLCSSWCYSYCVSRTSKVQLLVFMFLALFVALQVIMELFRWSSFGDGVGSSLSNWKTLWGVWVMVLGNN